MEKQQESPKLLLLLTAPRIVELRMRIAFAEHRAHLALTLVRSPEGSSRIDAYARLGRPAAALVDDTTTIVFSPGPSGVCRRTRKRSKACEAATLQTLNFDAIGWSRVRIHD